MTVKGVERKKIKKGVIKLPRKNVEVEEQLIYVFIKGGEGKEQKTRTFRTVDKVPEDIPVGSYCVKRTKDGVVIGSSNITPNANVLTVKGARYIAETDAEGKMTLTPAPDMFTFVVEKNEGGGLKAGQMSSAVRSFIHNFEPNGAYGLVKSGTDLQMRKLL